MYKELLHFIIHSSCNFAVTSNNPCIKELGWIQFEGRFYILVVRVQCLVKFISFISFSSDIGIIRIMLVKKRFLRCHYILFHLANISIRKNNRYRSSHLAAINLFSQPVVCKKTYSVVSLFNSFWKTDILQNGFNSFLTQIFLENIINSLLNGYTCE